LTTGVEWLPEDPKGALERRYATRRRERLPEQISGHFDMPLLIVSVWQIAGLILGLAALTYLALRAMVRFREGAVMGSGKARGVSVLRPVHGDGPLLYECLRSFCVRSIPSDFRRAYRR
jgi:hypothetical protein